MSKTIWQWTAVSSYLVALLCLATAFFVQGLGGLLLAIGSLLLYGVAFGCVKLKPIKKRKV